MLIKFGWERKIKVLMMTKSVLSLVVFVAGVFLSLAGGFLLLQGSGERPVMTPYKGSSVCGLSAVANICGIFGRPLELTEVYSRAGAPLDHKLGISLLSCKRALEASGINCTSLRFDSIDELPEATPIILTILLGKNQQGEDRLHAVVAIRRDKRVLIIDEQKVSTVALDRLDKQVGDIAIVTNIVKNLN
ncbi:MAG: cysteine peptidase family C39 domain-containing protein [Planctomycetota bacterium]|jgi:hypothetical protein